MFIVHQVSTASHLSFPERSGQSEDKKMVDLDSLKLRKLCESDIEVIKDLHEDFFPISYSYDFYKKACNGIGLRGGDLYNIVAVEPSSDANNDGEGPIVGFILAQVFASATAISANLFSALSIAPSRVCYILTLGLIPRYRRSGMGSLFVRKLCDDMAKDKGLGAM